MGDAALAGRIVSKDFRHQIHYLMLSGAMRSRAYAIMRPSLRRLMVSGSTDILIEGYPRSANTYCVAAFLRANGETSRIASHLHTVEAVRHALKLNKPVVVLTRTPVDAISSLLLRQQGLSPRLAIGQYLDFYSRMQDYADRCVVAPFEVATARFGDVITEVNIRFGTRFANYAGDAEDEQFVREWIERRHRSLNNGLLLEHAIARPSVERHAAKAHIAAELDVFRDEMFTAETLFIRLNSYAPSAWDL
jgi:hypothetical protein